MCGHVYTVTCWRPEDSLCVVFLFYIYMGCRDRTQDKLVFIPLYFSSVHDFQSSEASV